MSLNLKSAPFFSLVLTALAVSCARADDEVTAARFPDADAVLVDDALYAIDAAKANGIGILAIYDESSRESWAVIQKRADHAIASWSDFHLPASKTAGL